MGTQSSFNLNKASLGWREELARHGITPAEANELESHLYDAMAELQQHGLSEEEAFWIARHRLGPAPDLAEQFAKADPGRVWKDRIFWAAALSLSGLLWMRVWGFWFANLHSSAGVSGSWSNALLQILTLLPLMLVAFLLIRGRLQSFCSWVARPFRSQFEFARILAWVLLGFLGVMSIQLLQQADSLFQPVVVTQFRGGLRQFAIQAVEWKAHTNFWGTLLANAAWPAALVLLMFSAARRREVCSG